MSLEDLIGPIGPSTPAPTAPSPMGGLLPPAMDVPDDDSLMAIRQKAIRAHQDPVYRQKLLSDINAGPASTVRLKPINPFESPAEWASKTWENAVEPVKQAWNSDKWWGKPLAVLTAPLQLAGLPITGLTTALGFQHASSGMEAGMQYASDPSMSTPAALGALGVGLAADFLNPAFFLTQGARPLTKAAERILREPIGAAGVRDAAEVQDILSTTRHGAGMTEDNVRRYVAPRMLLDNYRNTFSKMPTTLEGANIHVTPGDPAIFENVWGPGRSTNKIVNGRTYDEALNQYRNVAPSALKEHAEFPRDLMLDPAIPVDQKLDRLAAHQAYTEKEILAGRPRTRIYGIDVGPSLTKGLSEGTSRLLGLWKQRQYIDKPLHELTDAKRAAQVGKFMTERGMEWDANATPMHMLLNMEQIQSPFRAQHTGLLTAEGSHGDMDSLVKWVGNELASVPAYTRVEHLGRIREVYRTALDLLEKEPSTVTALDKAHVQQAIEKIDKMAAGMPQLDRAISRSKPEFLLQYHQRQAKEGLDRILQIASDHDRELNKIVGPGMTPNQAAEALSRSVVAGRGPYVNAQGALTELPKLFKKVMQGYEGLLNARTAYPYASQWRQMRLNSHDLLRQIHDTMIHTEDTVRRAFLGQHGSGPIDGTLLLGDLIDRPGFWKDTLGKSGATHPWSPKFAPLPPQAAADVRKRIFDHIDQHVTRARMEPARAARLKAHIASLDDTGLTHVVAAMKDLAESHLKGSMQAALLDRLTEPMRPMLEKINGVLMTQHDREIRDILEEMNRFQATYDPRWGFKWLMKTGGPIDRINRVAQSAFIKSGFSPALYDTLRGMVQNHDNVPVEAAEFGHNTVSKGHILDSFKAYDPAKFGNVGPALEEKINNAVGDILPFTMTEARVQRQLAPLVAVGKDAGPLGTRLRAELAVAQSRIRGGREYLKTILGDDATVDRVLQDVEKKLRTLQDKEYAEEVRLGLGGVYRRNYHPWYISGNEKDKDLLMEAMRIERGEQSLGMADRAQISRAFQHSKNRYFPDAASIQAYIDEINANPALFHLDHPLDVKVGSNLSAAYALRKSRQLKALVNRDALAKMQAVLPGNMLTMRLTNEGNAAVQKGWGFRSVEDMIPSMKGVYVPEALYKYIEHFVPQYKREATLWDTFHRMNNWLARQMVRFNLVHVKNIAALSAIAGVPTRTMDEFIGWAVQEAKKYPKEIPFLERMSMALDSHPLYKDSVRNGITHHRGAEQFMSVDQVVESRMRPAGNRVLQYLKGGDQGPIQQLTFGILDKVAKMSLYKDMLTKGLPPGMAADWTNHFLIDYAARNLNPNLKRIGHAVMPFFGWRVGNALLHIPNALENPGRYAAMNYVRDYLSDALMHTNPYDREHVPEALAEAVFLPITYRSGLQAAAFPDFPQDPYFRLIRRSVMTNPTNPFAWRAELGNFLLSRTRVGELLYDAIKNRDRLSKETFWSTMMGTGNRGGYASGLLWGLMPMYQTATDAAQAMWDPKMWRNDLVGDLLGALMRVNPVTPEGKVVR